MPVSPNDARRLARIAACQAAYMLESKQSDVLAETLSELTELADAELDNENLAITRADQKLLDFFRQNHADHAQEAEELLGSVMGTPITVAEPLELAMLRMATLELGWRRDTSPAIVISEWLEVSRHLGSSTSYTYINAILEHMRVKLGR